jgi:hypothetical protein
MQCAEIGRIRRERPLGASPSPCVHPRGITLEAHENVKGFVGCRPDILARHLFVGLLMTGQRIDACGVFFLNTKTSV